MELEWYRYVLNITQIIVFIFCIVIAVRRLKNSKQSIILIFFIYGLICSILSSIYWLVQGLINPDLRLLFGVNEIAEAGMFLLYASMLNVLYGKEKLFKSSETLLAALFAVGVMALWIAWTSEWIKDILSGLSFGYYICSSINALKVSKAFKKPEWIILGIGSFGLLILQTIIFFVPERIGGYLDMSCYFIMLTGLLWLIIKTIIKIFSTLELKKDEETHGTAALSYLCFTWTVNSMYMSSEPWYYVHYCSIFLMVPMILYSTLLVEKGGKLIR